MPLQATSGAASYDAFGGGVPFEPVYIESIFQTWLYTGNGSTQTITNGIDLAGKGGLVWLKSRSGTTLSGYDKHILFDTARGNTVSLSTNNTAANETGWGNSYLRFLSNGFDTGTGSPSQQEYLNKIGTNYVSWTFREQPKFFDVVTYTGDGTSPRSIAHNLGSTAACVMVKRTDTTGNWKVLFTGLTRLCLNSTEAEMGTLTVQGGYIDNANATTFTLVSNAGSVAEVNASGGTYVAYVFASNAGGFGLTGTDNVISCGSFTTDGSGNATVDLGYEPQWVLYKPTANAGSWRIMDTMRSNSETSTQILFPNTSAPEASYSSAYNIPKATGIVFPAGFLLNSEPYIYIAIRRGPMKVPTDGTKVFSPISSTSPTGTVKTTGFPVDMQIQGYRLGGVSSTQRFVDRLRGVSTSTTESGRYLASANTNAEVSTTNTTRFWDNTGFQQPSAWDSSDTIFWNFRRAPGTFDEVCYTGTGVARTVAHNLAAAPELMIIKSRSAAGYWPVYSAAIGNDYILSLDTTGAKDGPGAPQWNSTTPTASVFSLGASSGANANGTTFVAYLWATNPGVTKVGTYTGNGTSQTINCGFTSGARFVMIKAASTTGNWLVADSARGIVAGNDPALYLNSTAAEITGFDWIDADSTGFVVNETATIAANTNGVQYIFLSYS
jgi:hypothetical protein